MFVVIDDTGKILSSSDAARVLGLDGIWSWAYAAEDGLPLLTQGENDGRFVVFPLHREYRVLGPGELAWQVDWRTGKVQTPWLHIMDKLQHVVDGAQFAAEAVLARKPHEALIHMVEAMIALASAGVSLYHALDAAGKRKQARRVQDYDLVGLSFQETARQYSRLLLNPDC